jgi:hypothetical protein
LRRPHRLHVPSMVELLHDLRVELNFWAGQNRTPRYTPGMTLV